MLSRLFVMVVLVLALAFVVSGTALAAPTGNTGQPNQTCQDLASQTGMSVTPGNAGSSTNTGSPFSPNGISGTVYAGNGANTGTPANSHAVSQYDVSCFQQTQH